jgi:thiamine biosynthesis lipoprotein
MGTKQLVFAALLCSAQVLLAQQKAYRYPFTAMGSSFEVVVVAGVDSSDWAWGKLLAAEGEIKRIEKLISSWDPDSETSRLNRLAGGDPVEVDQELSELIWRSVGIYGMTEGAFDITYAGMAHVWDFSAARRNEWPDSSLVDSLRQLVDAKSIQFLFDGKIGLEKEGMRIGFGGIGKGYAADKAAKLLQEQGVHNGVVNASGDIYAWGHDDKNRPWRVAVVDPRNKNKVRMWLTANRQAVVTSGDYEKYKVKDDTRYAHIINPATGYPVTGITSATVIAMRAELADALATAIFVLGKDKGLALIDSLNGIECIIIDDDGNIWYSKNISPQEN